MDSAILRGIKSKASATALGKVNGVVIPAISQNDTSSNPLNAMYLVAKAVNQLAPAAGKWTARALRPVRHPGRDECDHVEQQLGRSGSSSWIRLCSRRASLHPQTTPLWWARARVRRVQTPSRYWSLRLESARGPPPQPRLDRLRPPSVVVRWVRSPSFRPPPVPKRRTLLQPLQRTWR